jgi:D-arabinose 1-dehydrogenase-like Zn-dependent alcohol dehydrogenase
MQEHERTNTSGHEGDNRRTYKNKHNESNINQKPREMRVVEMSKPGCEAGEVLLRIRYVGFCGSDLNSFRGSNSMARYPLIPGHEVGAEIAEVGANVPPTLQPGMVVTVNPYTSCGQCGSCRRRRYNACEHNETLGVQRNGAMREYLAVPWQKVIPVTGYQYATAPHRADERGFHAWTAPR